MSNERLCFSSEEEQKLVDSVREEPFLCNVHHPDYKKLKLRENKWLEISTKVGKSSKIFSLVLKFGSIHSAHKSFRSHLENDCCKKWRHLRDYYKKNRGPVPTTGSSINAIRKRCTQLSFLEDTSIIQRA